MAEQQARRQLLRAQMGHTHETEDDQVGKTQTQLIRQTDQSAELEKGVTKGSENMKRKNKRDDYTMKAVEELK